MHKQSLSKFYYVQLTLRPKLLLYTYKNVTYDGSFWHGINY